MMMTMTDGTVNLSLADASSGGSEEGRARTQQAYVTCCQDGEGAISEELARKLALDEHQPAA